MITLLQESKLPLYGDGHERIELYTKFTSEELKNCLDSCYKLFNEYAKRLDEIANQLKQDQRDRGMNSLDKDFKMAWVDVSKDFGASSFEISGVKWLGIRIKSDYNWFMSQPNVKRIINQLRKKLDSVINTYNIAMNGEDEVLFKQEPHSGNWEHAGYFAIRIGYKVPDNEKLYGIATTLIRGLRSNKSTVFTSPVNGHQIEVKLLAFRDDGATWGPLDYSATVIDLTDKKSLGWISTSSKPSEVKNEVAQTLGLIAEGESLWDWDD